MKIRIAIGALATGLSLYALLAFSSNGRQALSDRWEYRVEGAAGAGINPHRHQAQLDSLGADGWELIAVLGEQMGGNTGAATFYLRRRLP